MERYTSGSVQRYLFSIKLFISIVGKSNTISAKYIQITDYLNILREKGYSSQYVETELYGIKSYYAWLQITQQRFDNPTNKLFIHNIKSRDVQFQNLFTENELGFLLKRENRYGLLNWRNKLAISFYIYQGLTTGEIVNLTIHDINLDNSLLFIRSGRNISRLLQLNDEQMFFLKQYLTFDRPFLIKYPTEILLIGKLGKPEAGEGIQYLIECQRLLFPDRKLNPKTIRQSAIVNLFNRGWDIKDVQLFAGHHYPTTTEIYKPQDLSALSKAISKFHPLDDF